jgi:hypothetical protein
MKAYQNNIQTNSMDINQYWESYKESIQNHQNDQRRGVQYEI